MTTYKLFLLPGDGIGPEVMAEVEKVTAFFTREGSVRFEIEKGLVGGCAYDAHGKAISDAIAYGTHPRSAHVHGKSHPHNKEEASADRVADRLRRPSRLHIRRAQRCQSP